METLHYLLLADHLTFQKVLMTRIKDTGLTPGQPKVLDYLRCHDGAVQKTSPPPAASSRPPSRRCCWAWSAKTSSAARPRTATAGASPST